VKRLDEAGVSIVEILIATFILFFVITALAGLLTMAFAMTNSARRQTAGTVFAQELMEEIRAMSYSDIGTIGGDPEGPLPALETTVSGDITYTVQREITWVDDVSDNDPQTPEGADDNREDYKDVSITLSWLASNGATSTVSVQTSIRQPWVSTNSPSVEFTDQNVPANSIVYSNRIYVPYQDPGEHPYLYVQATGNDNADADGRLASMIFYVDGRVLRNPSYTPDAASWAPAAQSWTSPLYPWDTLALDESGTALYPDGIRELKTEVWDNSGARDFKIINVFVDNFAPDTPSNLVSSVSVQNASCFNKVGLTWTGVRDGTDWADRYELARYRNGADDTVLTIAGTLAEWDDSPLTPFTWYRYSLRALSPMDRSSSWTATTPAVMTRPMLTATVTKSGNNRTANLTWSAPTFSCSSLHYHVYYLKPGPWSGSNLTTEVDATKSHGYTSTTWTSFTYNKTDVYYWQMRASLYIGGTHYSVYSNVIGPSSSDITVYPIP